MFTKRHDQCKELCPVAIYRPPTGNSTSFFSILEELLEYLRTLHCRFLIMADVNIDSLRENASAYELNNILATFGSRNKIALPIRITLGTGSSLNICVSNLGDTEVISGVFSYDLTDHLPIFCLTPTLQRTQKRKNALSRWINLQTLEHFGSLVKSENWSCVYYEQDPNEG